jgi:Protein of unknown function (DUF3300)
MTDKISTKMRRLALCVVPLVLVWNVAPVPANAQDAAAPAPAQSQSQQSFSQAQIKQLVAPIALYPDPLLTQILMASTYPLEVVEAARWSHNNPSVTGQALENAMQDQSWDPSVKALTAVPQTLEMMSDKLAWTEELGDAFLAQQQDVLAAVQTLRGQAQAEGNLNSTPQQLVTTEPAPAGVAAPSGPAPIVIEPVNPGVYYVPVYNPAVVYGAWGYPDYPPFYWSPPGFIAGNIVSFTASVAVGSAIWSGCNWWNHDVVINVNRYNIFNHTNITNNVWEHNPAHRGNVPYRNAALAERFGRSNEAAAREALRDRVDVQHDDMFRDRADVPRDDILKDRPNIQRYRPDVQREDVLRQAEGDADRRVEPALPDRRDEVRRDGGNHQVDRAMPERRDVAPERNDARRQLMRSRAQAPRPEARAMGGGFHFHGGGRHRL